MPNLFKRKPKRPPEPSRAQVDAIALPETLEGTLGNLRFVFDTAAGSKSYDEELESWCDGIASALISGSGATVDTVCDNKLIQYGLAKADALGLDGEDRTAYAFAVFVKSHAGCDNFIEFETHRNPEFKADIEAAKSALADFDASGPRPTQAAAPAPSSKPRF